MTALDGCQSRGVTEPQRDGGPLAVDEVLKTKDSFTYNTSSVVAKRCAGTFPKGEGKHRAPPIKKQKTLLNL